MKSESQKSLIDRINEAWTKGKETSTDAAYSSVTEILSECPDNSYIQAYTAPFKKERNYYGLTFTYLRSMKKEEREELEEIFSAEFFRKVDIYISNNEYRKYYFPAALLSSGIGIAFTINGAPIALGILSLACAALGYLHLRNWNKNTGDIGDKIKYSDIVMREYQKEHQRRKGIMDQDTAQLLNDRLTPLRDHLARLAIGYTAPRESSN